MNQDILTLATALGLGLLVGLQRERASASLAGFRTFPLVTVFGSLCTLLALVFGQGVVAAGFIALSAAIVAGNLFRPTNATPEPDAGITTEIAMLVMFGVGAYLPVGERSLAMVVTAATAVLLHLKPQLHSFAKQIGDRDFRAIMQFVVIALLVLPALPDERFGPYAALNPYRIWWMVALITGLSLTGYLLHKWLGDRAGALAAGLLGGLVSSTATSLTHSRLTRTTPAVAPTSAVVILLASGVVFIRLLLLVAATDREHLSSYVVPFVAMLGVLAGAAAWFGFRERAEGAAIPLPSNPTELRSALVFTGIYALVLVGVAAARERYGKEGLFVIATISGLTDMDAITLSTAQLAKSGRITPGDSARAVVLAAVSNLAFKAGIVGVFGDRSLLRRISVPFLLGSVAGLACVWFR